jgi:biopolymer transport protein ExbD
MAGGARSSAGDEPIAEINIVPFVDIILVVLIIFMVTTPVIMKPSINVNLPEAGSGDETAPSKLAVVVAADGSASLNGKAADENAIRDYAAGLVKQRPDVQAVVSADRSVSSGRMIGLIDVIKAAGVKRIAIAVDKKK